MNFCPNCGTALTGMKGAFCYECGHRLISAEPGITAFQKEISTTQSPSQKEEDTEGWEIVDSVARNLEILESDIPTPSVKSFASSSIPKGDFQDSDYDALLQCLEGVESFFNRLREIYGKRYDHYIDELSRDTKKYLDILDPFLSDNSPQGYPRPLKPFLPKCRSLLIRTIPELQKDKTKNHDNTILTLRLYIRSIELIEDGDYRKFRLTGEQPASDNNNPVTPQPTEPPKHPAERHKSGFEEKIASLEEELSGNLPLISSIEYNTSTDYNKELNKLIGLGSLKEQMSAFIDNYKLQLKRREDHPGLKIDTSFNCVFKGKPGTGKTTVARLMAGILRQNGILKGGQLVEVDASSLVSGWMGFSAKATALAAYKAMDGVLFIDEAYALMNNFEGSRGAGPGKDVIDTLTPIMENYRDRFIVIVAGYDEEMEKFLQAANTGFPSRFKQILQFSDYTPDEMTAIFRGLLRSNFYVTGAKELRIVNSIFNEIYKRIPSLPGFANARTVRNIFERICQRASKRMIANPKASRDLIIADDIMLSPEEIKMAVGLM